MSQYRPPNPRHDLQAKCDHRKAVEISRSWMELGREEVLMAHMHCERCGMFYGLDIWGARRQLAEDQAS